MSAARAAENVERKRLEELDRDLDPGVGRRTRFVLALAVGVFWTLAPLGLHRAVQNGFRPTHVDMARVPALVLAAILLGVFLFGKTMLKTTFNRRILGAIAFSQLLQVALQSGAWAAGIAPVTSEIVKPLLWMTIAGMLAITVEIGLVFATAGYFLAFLVTATWPELRYFASAAAHGVTTLNVLLVWRQKKRKA